MLRTPGRLCSHCRRENACAADTRADAADVRAHSAQEEAAGLREQLRVVQERAAAAAEVAAGELRRERELAADMALGLQAQIGDLTQHAAQVRKCTAMLQKTAASLLKLAR